MMAAPKKRRAVPRQCGHAGRLPPLPGHLSPLLGLPRHTLSNCDCGLQCPDCVELFEVYLEHMSAYRARHLDLLGEDNLRDLMWLTSDQARITNAFKNFGWLSSLQ